MTKESIISFPNGEMQIDLDIYAEKIGISTKELMHQLRSLAISYLFNEAERLNAKEQWDKKTKIYPYPPIKDEHLVQAAKEMLSIENVSRDQS